MRYRPKTVSASLAFLLVIAAGLVARAGDALTQRVEAEAQRIAPQVVQWRRDFHRHPELSNREERTSRVVADALRQMGVDEVKTGVAHHGVVALIRGKKEGPVVALRADMDALPIQEETGVPFASENPGVMHACGHDAHTAMLLGAAEVLCGLREEIGGTVKLVFQPAEEGVPEGEEGGARLMIKEGVLQDPKVDAIFGMHVMPGLEPGKLGYRAGGLLAAVDRFRVTVTGKQSHAAMPWQGVDPIVVSSHIITALQTIVSRKLDARASAVVSVGILRGGTAWNIIPETVTIEGTIRTHDDQVRRQAAAQFKRIVTQTAAAHGAEATIDVFYDYGPVTWNDPSLTDKILPTLAEAAGSENLVEVKPIMGGEDFAHYSHKVPGVFVFLGAKSDAKGASQSLHNPKLMIDEAAFPMGVKVHCLLALRYLEQSRR